MKIIGGTRPSNLARSGRHSVFDDLDRIVKYSAFVGVFVYAVGLVFFLGFFSEVSNLGFHVVRLGPQLIPTGAIILLKFLSPLLLGSFLWLILLKAESWRRPRSSWLHSIRLRRLIRRGTLYLALLLPALFILPHWEIRQSIEDVHLLTWEIASILIGNLLLYSAVTGFQNDSGLMGAFRQSTKVLFALGAILAFSMTTGKVDWVEDEIAWLSGETPTCRLLVAENVAEDLEQFGMKFTYSESHSEKAALTEAVYPLHEGDDDWLVRLTNGQLILLRADKVWGKIAVPSTIENHELDVHAWDSAVDLDCSEGGFKAIHYHPDRKGPVLLCQINPAALASITAKVDVQKMDSSILKLQNGVTTSVDEVYLTVNDPSSAKNGSKYNAYLYFRTGCAPSLPDKDCALIALKGAKEIFLAQASTGAHYHVHVTY